MEEEGKGSEGIERTVRYLDAVVAGLVLYHLDDRIPEGQTLELWIGI